LSCPCGAAILESLRYFPFVIAVVIGCHASSSRVDDARVATTGGHDASTPDAWAVIEDSTIADTPNVSVPADAPADAPSVSMAHDAAVDAKLVDAGSSAVHDAAIDASSSAVHDAAIDASTGYGGSDAGVAGAVSCYSEGNPGATCTLPTHCCFTNYSSQHNGQCTSSACTWGTITCDGPEDCPAAQRCCSHAIKDSSDTVIGYLLACQATACGSQPLNEELCHPTLTPAGTCSAGQCVTTVNHNNDLPRTLYICR
jgi:hypothetical protein